VFGTPIGLCLSGFYFIAMTQKELFNKIWEERPHVSEVSGKPLLPKGHSQWHWQFAHVLSKGAFPSYKFNPDNIMLMLPEEHEKQEMYSAFKNKAIDLKLQYFTEGRDFPWIKNTNDDN